MPSRDPSRDALFPEPRWDSDRPHEAGHEVERRHRPTAFSEQEHGAHGNGRAEPGTAFTASHQMRATGSAGRASGAQAWADEPGPADRPADARDEAARPAQIERRRAGGAWERVTPERGRMPIGPGRSGPDLGDSVGRRAVAHGTARADDTQFDADYRQWREEQMRLLDLDYAQWRKERYRKFAEEFSQWRNQRLKASPVDDRGRAEEAPSSLGDISPLGTPPAPPLRAEERPHEPERERTGGGLLGSLLGSHSERHKPQS